MLKRILICSVIFAGCLNAAWASNYQNGPVRPIKHHYKGETTYPVYKGEIVSPPPPNDTRFPCRTYAIKPGPYLGINPEVRTNYNETGSVYKAFEGTVFAGYGMLSSNFYLAAELFGQHGTELQNYRNNLNNNLNPVGVRTTWGAGLSILPGLVLADTLLGYLRLGGIETHFTDAGETTLGGQVGIGIEGTVSESWDVRAEYTYSFYQSMQALGSPRSDQFRLGVLYKFWS